MSVGARLVGALPSTRGGDEPRPCVKNSAASRLQPWPRKPAKNSAMCVTAERQRLTPNKSPAHGPGWLDSFRTLLTYGVESFLNFGPVHGVPPGSNVFGPAVLVLEIVGVFPNVESQDRVFAFGNGTILVGG